MKTYSITKNEKAVKTGLSKEQADKLFFCVVEDQSNGYIYDNEAETIYNEVSGQVCAKKGDDCVDAGDYRFEIVEETYNIHFNDENNSNDKGFAMSYDDAMHYIKTYNGTSESYFADYKGGTVSIVNNVTGETVYEEEVK